MSTTQTSTPRSSKRQSHAASLVSDGFLRDLMAAGQADILIGLPTHNDAATAGRVARTVHELFTRVYARRRTVLLHLDGGSTDDSTQVVATSGVATRDSSIASFSLRTQHLISAPYHAVSGRGHALRLVFTAADLLDVRAIAVLSPDACELSVDDLARLLQPVLEAGKDYVKPIVPRAAHEGPLVTQLVRPLLGTIFGQRLLEPVDRLLACSPAFARKALKTPLWDTQFAQYGPDPWLGALAALEGFALAQAHVHAQTGAPRGQFADLFRQITGSSLNVITHEAARWRAITEIRDVPSFGAPSSAVDAGAPAFDVASAHLAFRQGLDDLQPLLSEILPPELLAALRAADCGETVALDDALWVRTVYAFVSSAARRSFPLDQIAQALQPIYLGRLCCWLGCLSAAQSSAAAEALHRGLAAEFESHRPEFVAAWPMSDAG